MDDLEIVKLCAMAMGWEFLPVGYIGTEEETPRQRELSDWMDKVGLYHTGDYWIDVFNDFFMEAHEYKPLTDNGQAMALVQRFHLNIQAPEFVSPPRWHVWKEPKPNFTGIADVLNLNHAICECVASLMQNHPPK